jgi:hypothetical protein
MTNTILENHNDSKIEELMEELLNDYKGDLIKKEQKERDILDLFQMDIDILKNHQIPFYSEKYGVSPMDKEYLNLLLNLVQDVNNYLKLSCGGPNDEISIDDATEKIKELLHTWIDDSEDICNKIQQRLEKYNETLCSWTIDYDSFLTMGECLKNIYDKTKHSEDDFKFHKDSYVKLMETKTGIESQLMEIRENYDNSKKQCLRTIKKINHLIHKKIKNGYPSLLGIIENAFHPFIKLNSEKTSISLNVK